MRAYSVCLAALALVASASPALAQDAEVAFNVAASSDYVFRGFSQTNEDPAFSGGIDLTSGRFYFGAWASNVDFGDETDAELDFYGGYRTEAGGYALDLGVVSYIYLDDADGSDYDYVELKAAASRAIGPATFGAVVYYSPDFFGADDEAVYVEGNAAFTPTDKWTVSAALGHQWLDVSSDYLTWNVGLAYALTDNLVLDARYHDTDVDNVAIADGRVVGTVKLLF